MWILSLEFIERVEYVYLSLCVNVKNRVEWKV